MMKNNIQSIIPQQHKQLQWVVFYRAFAVILIVAWHMGYIVFPYLRLSYGFIGAILESGTMIFVFISGYLFRFHLPAHFSYSKYLSGRFKNICIPYLTASAILLALQALKGKSVDCTAIVYAFLFGKAAVQLWFIPMIMLFYIAAPLFLWFERKNRYPWLFLLFLCPFLLGRGSFAALGQNTLFFLPFYISGIFFAVRENRIWENMQKYRVMIYCFGFICLLFAGIYPAQETVQTCTKLFIASSLLIFFRRNETHIAKRNNINAILTAISNAGLGIYLYHNSVIGIFGKKIWNLFHKTANEPFAVLYLLFGTAFCIAILLTGLNIGRRLLIKCKLPTVLLGYRSGK